LPYILLIEIQNQTRFLNGLYQRNCSYYLLHSNFYPPQNHQSSFESSEQDEKRGGRGATS
jgi:hypothetical protein